MDLPTLLERVRDRRYQGISKEVLLDHDFGLVGEALSCVRKRESAQD